MKPIYLLSLLTISFVSFVSCEKLETPEALYSVNVVDPLNPDDPLDIKQLRALSPEGGKFYAKVNEQVYFKALNDADYHVVWTGDTLHNYAYRNNTLIVNNKYVFNTGWALNEGMFSYKYTSAGSYKIVFVATNSANNQKDFKQSRWETELIVE